MSSLQSPRTRLHSLWDLAAFAHDGYVMASPFRWDDERRSAPLRTGLVLPNFIRHPPDDADYILETFLPKRKDVARHGEYRTKRHPFEIFDAMSAGENTKRAWILPADPRVAHPLRL